MNDLDAKKMQAEPDRSAVARAHAEIGAIKERMATKLMLTEAQGIMQKNMQTQAQN